ncbi:MAG TPA: DEAD/DEAH box helicase family protein [Ignavibacteria bacterium]|nr:DEAD/DEAH box helicase family protein [Ignavibacteria bacterium]HMR41765.1 DEAD/DEAH box helicase family protein [Ignavibacteria bacterium]
MDLKLYSHIRKHFLKESIDLFDKTTQEKIEAFDASIGFDEKIFDAIKKYLKAYNTYLESQKLEKVKLRYYQILAIYFTEVYFLHKSQKDFADFSQNALAYWMATGSGKTIIMHINVFQFIKHNKGFKDLELIITTPGVNLIQQHEREVTPLIEYLNKIHRNKIRFTIDTTNALLNKPDDFFDFPDNKNYQRLILVDEAHIGLGKNQKDDEGEFLKLRRRLNIKHSFLFEYSATFHNLSSALENEYCNSIIYDYNYNLFYRDGYGKDFYFEKVGADLLKSGSLEDNLSLNLNVIEEKLNVYNKLDYTKIQSLFSATVFPDRPLIAFMGNTVNDKTKEGKDDELSDISKIIDYLANLTEPERAKFKNLFNNDYKGRLKLTRNTQADDEILLSYGAGDYWGIVNVGNGLGFINDYKGDNVDKVTSTSSVITNIEKYLFENIDKPQSPINILIGSRKFAEGWNCFRVSVIGLINLGKSKGNKIIQIFGRGVRLKGLNNDGKRNDMKHIEEYFSLTNTDNDLLKRLETLCVFSLQRSYLEAFTEAVSSELKITKNYEFKVKPNVLEFNGKKASFDKYKDDLKIFKLSRNSVDVKKVYLSPDDKEIEYECILDGKLRKGSINNFTFSLDYRTSLNYEGMNIRNSLVNENNNYKEFINYQIFTRTILDQADEFNLQIYKSGEKLSDVKINDVLSYVDEIRYKNEIPEFDFDFIENLNVKVTEEFVKKVRNKINWHLNSSIYLYGEIEQSQGDRVGDFIEQYTLVKSFDLSKEEGANKKPKSETELNEEIDAFGKTIKDVEDSLMINQIGNHVYNPLLLENKSVLKEDVKLSPDKLNQGESKFVNDFTNYLDSNSEKLKDFKVYLMRNVESLKSIGIYLDDDTQVFYPDFIMWMIGKDKIYINFIDPKGQMGINDLNTNELKEKIRIADKVANQTLPNIESQLKLKYKKEFVINSFTLLRDSSELGKNADAEWKKENMISKNILRLDWHEIDEKDNTTDPAKWVDDKSYLDWIFEVILQK